jgi:glycine hydroxymethyltransferase
MKLSHGGHLSHGDAASMTSRCFDFQHYGLNLETEQLDYDEIEHLAHRFRPRMIVAGASSYPRLIDYDKIAKVARSVSAILLVDMAHIAGLVAAKVIPSPVPHADFVTFTTYKTLRAGRGGVILCKQKHIDRINRAIFPGGQGTPSLNLIAAKAVCFQLAQADDFIELQRKTLKNAGCFAAEFKRLGYRMVSGGTENHLVLIDLRSKGLTGALAETTLESVGIIVNRNVIPADPEKPEISSGIRIGSPAITSRGMQEPEVRQIARLMDTAMSNTENSQILAQVAQEVQDLCKQFPIQY